MPWCEAFIRRIPRRGTFRTRGSRVVDARTEFVPIESLDVHELDGEATLQHRYLGYLPAFKSLKIHKLPPLQPPIPGTIMFPVLQQLVIYFERIAPIVAFVNTLGRSPLGHLLVTFAAYPTTREIRSLHAALIDHCSHDTLQLLNLDMPPRLLLGAPEAPQLWAVKPLFCFVNMINVQLVSPIGFDLDDTIHAGICRHSTLRQLPTTRIRQDTLYKLHVDNSTIEAPFPTARFLSGIFDNLTVVVTNLENFAEEELPPGAFTTHHRWKDARKSDDGRMPFRRDGLFDA
ncbi:hypothetical protein FB451DRAFT_1506458 [Mycena latifolia]|nr:hypothetical protein FB451DRAFT_1506458 [Mycena latifolia]